MLLKMGTTKFWLDNRNMVEFLQYSEESSESYMVWLQFWKGFQGEGNLEDFCFFKKITVVGYLHDPVFSIYKWYCIMYNQTSLIPTRIREESEWWEVDGDVLNELALKF